MHASLRASLTGLFAASTVAALVLAWHARRRPWAVVVPLPVVVREPDVLSSADWGIDPAGRAAEFGDITVGNLDLARLPPGTVKEVGREASEDLVGRMKEWAQSESFRPMIDLRTGIAYARTADPDREVDADRRQVCGTPAEWMLSVLQQRIAGQDLVCDRNVCWLDGGGAPDDYIVFEPIMLGAARDWALVAWLQVAPDASLHELPTATRCPGSAADHYR